MPNTDPRKAFQMRREFWADKAANAKHVANMEAKRDSAIVIDWTRRFEIARAMANR